MLKDITSQKKVDAQLIANAIKSLQAKGWDVNPYTVADEAKVPRSAVYRSPEAMHLINEVKGAASAEIPDDHLLVEGSDVAQPQPEVRAEGTDEPAMDTAGQLERAEQRARELEWVVKQLEDELVRLKGSQQDSWHAGYEAGLKEGRAQIPSPEEPGTTNGAPTVEAMDLNPVSSVDPVDPQPSLVSEPELTTGGALQDSVLQDSPPEEEPDQGGQPYECSEYGPEISVPDEEFYASGTSPASGQEEEYTEQETAPVSQAMSPEEEFQPIDMPIDALLVDPQPAEHFDQAYSDEDKDTWGSPMVEDESSQADSSKASPISRDELQGLLNVRFGKSGEEPPAKEPDSARKMTGSRFVGGNRANQEPPPSGFVIRSVPQDIRKACLVLGLRPEEVTHESVHTAWKREITNPGSHPDLGGDTEIAVYLNTAKDQLYRWLDAKAPKLGKQFKKPTREGPRAEPGDSAQGQEEAK